MSEEWYPFAERRDGPAHKVNPGVRPADDRVGAVVHSAEGSEAGALSVLDGERPASWHFTVLQDGRVLQHYPRSARTWHAGALANSLYVGIECEGVAGVDLTPSQLDALTNLLAWLAAEESWLAARRGVTLFEHNEFMSTACPSGRIPWAVIEERLGRLDPVFAGGSATPAADRGAESDPPPLFTIDEQLAAAGALYSTLWSYHALDSLPDWDRQVLRWLLVQL